MRCTPRRGTLRRVQEEQGIYRGEVEEIMFALADLKAGMRRLLSYIEEEDDGEEEEEEDV